MKCDKCDEKAIEYVRYSGAHFCSRHFCEFVEKRVVTAVKKEAVGKNEKIAMALSGGKDSSTALFILKKILPNELEAITIDEGIKGYRDKTIQVAKKNCKKLGVKHHTIDLRDETGFSTDDIYDLYEKNGLKHRECSHCGVMRRYYLNKKAREIDAEYLVLAHNLDDVAQQVLMNFVKNDLKRSSHTKKMEGFVPRILPLRKVPEREIAIYAILNDIDFYIGTCPYAKFAERNRFREVINILEDGSPSSKHGIVKSYDSIEDSMIAHKKIGKCEMCGEITGNRICKKCEMIMILENMKNEEERIKINK